MPVENRDENGKKENEICGASLYSNALTCIGVLIYTICLFYITAGCFLTDFYKMKIHKAEKLVVLSIATQLQ